MPWSPPSLCYAYCGITRNTTTVSHVTVEAAHTYLWLFVGPEYTHCGQLQWSWGCFISFAYIISFLHCLELNSELYLKSQLSAFMHLFFRLLLDTFMRVDWWLLADLLNLSREKEARDPYLIYMIQLDCVISCLKAIISKIHWIIWFNKGQHGLKQSRHRKWY